MLPVVLSSSGSATLPEILFTATAPGDYSGSIVITSTDPDENPFGFMVRASIAPPEPAGLDFNGFTIKPAQAAAGAAFSGGISGPPHATVVIEGNSDPGDAGGWVEAARVTLDASGLATLDQIPLPDTGGRRRFFLRMRLPAP